jgi:hypothetical protein
LKFNDSDFWLKEYFFEVKDAVCDTLVNRLNFWYNLCGLLGRQELRLLEQSHPASVINISIALRISVRDASAL